MLFTSVTKQTNKYKARKKEKERREKSKSNRQRKKNIYTVTKYHESLTKRRRRQTTNEKKRFVKDTQDKKLSSKIYKEFLRLNNE